MSNANVTPEAKAKPLEQPKWYRREPPKWIQYVVYAVVLVPLGALAIGAFGGKPPSKTKADAEQPPNAIPVAPTQPVPPGVGERQRMAKAVFAVVRARAVAGPALAQAPQCGDVTSKAAGGLLPIVRLREHPDLPGARQLLTARESALDCLVCSPGSSYARHCDGAEKQAQAAIAEIDKSLPTAAQLGPKWLESEAKEN
jgi:hypothetical protein